jgi:paraquat-inducible protein A
MTTKTFTPSPIASAPDPGTGAVRDEDMIACPTCDALHLMGDLPDGARATCVRCHAVLAAPRRSAMTRIVMLAGTSVILMIAAIFFPFLELTAAGITQRSSIMDVVMVFTEGPFVGLALAVGALIVVVPLTRFLALIYVLAPMALGSRPARDAIPVFRLAETLKPWAMAEIFIVGVAVALIKVAGLATLTLGPAFWAFVALVLVTAIKDTFMCRLTIWKTLEQRTR